MSCNQISKPNSHRPFSDVTGQRVRNSSSSSVSALVSGGCWHSRPGGLCFNRPDRNIQSLGNTGRFRCVTRNRDEPLIESRAKDNARYKKRPEWVQKMLKREVPYQARKIEEAIQKLYKTGHDERTTIVCVMCAFPNLSIADYLTIQRAVIAGRPFQLPRRKMRLV